MDGSTFFVNLSAIPGIFAKRTRPPTVILKTKCENCPKRLAHDKKIGYNNRRRFSPEQIESQVDQFDGIS